MKCKVLTVIILSILLTACTTQVPIPKNNITIPQTFQPRPATAMQRLNELYQSFIKNL